ncbi:DNA repair ATPase [Nocardia sp. NPDC057668]|uniref:DNA repair ATPase n=1 Tax=Nocardia sp. NPDC057668 TaxID=3346202 RepID=UPI00367121CD
MSVDSGPRPAEVAAAPTTGVDAGAYEVLRARLTGHAAELTRHAEALNDRRIETFGGSELTLLSSDRIRTAHNCVVRDVVALPGDRLLFAFNAFPSSRAETTPADTFAVHRVNIVPGGGTDKGESEALDLEPAEDTGLLDDPRFRADFAELYRYFAQTRLLRLRHVGDLLLAVFQTGHRLGDVRVLRWQFEADGGVRYLDNRGERNHTVPPAHDFEWIQTVRADEVPGRHPHLSIGGEVFVDTLGGALTVKVENDTETETGIYSEPVDEPLQSLADAQIWYARVGALILLRVLPYNETDWRYLIFNTRTRDVVRLDGIGRSCLQLPDEHGIVFPGGYYLATGVYKTFDAEVEGLEFEQVIRSGNGEDVLYVFRARAASRTLLLPYNLVRAEITAPIAGAGFTVLDNGVLVVLRTTTADPSPVHPVQLWRSPYVSDLYSATHATGTGPLARIGNADLVRGISECLALARMVSDMSPATAVFEAMIAACDRAFDRYHWLTGPDSGGIAPALGELRDTAAQMLGEFERVAALTDQAGSAVDAAAEQVASLHRSTRASTPRSAEDWVRGLTELRHMRGSLLTLRELQYVDLERIDDLEEQVGEFLRDFGHRAAEFLSSADSFDSYERENADLHRRSEEITTVAAASPLRARLDEQADGLHLVTEVVGSLGITDATVRTAILDRIGAALAGINSTRAILAARQRALAAAEGSAEFAAEFSVLRQSIAGALGSAGTPESCDEHLAKLLLAIENLESRSGDFDSATDQLAQLRDDVYEAFSSRKQAQLDERARHADRLANSAQRILAGIQRRTAAIDSSEAINAYFAADPMVERLRRTAGELRALGDPVRAAELDGRLIAARQEAGRTLLDRHDLYSGDGRTITLGRHRFTVNTQPAELTVVPHRDSLGFAITGTDYRAPVRDENFADTAPYWSQLLVSETPEVYRGEYLAADLLDSAETSGTVDELLAAAADGTLDDIVRAAAEQRFDEGYERGVHDHDAALILAAMLRLYREAELLRFLPAERAAAQLWWTFGVGDRPARMHEAQSGEDPFRVRWQTRIRSLARARRAFGRSAAVDDLCGELSTAIAEFISDIGLDVDSRRSAEYLFEELCDGGAEFATSAAVRRLLDSFHRGLDSLDSGAHASYTQDLRSLEPALAEQYQLANAWLHTFISHGDAADAVDLPEAIAVELCDPLARREVPASTRATVASLLGTHPLITNQQLTFRLDELLARCRLHRLDHAPGFRAYLRRRNELVTAERDRLRLDEYRPRPMHGFVRNQLLDLVHLPLIGDNLAKQLGTAGDDRRADQSGLLLLISPPGYGKTTLIEYVAAKLGLILVKVSGPALGHEVTSIDPDRAPNATARQELEKINFALELGNNVLLYLDDIQHTSPELLQKFISLCDGQRRMEGVWQGRTRTYDLRGKRFAVCMAGNPYTEQGKRFRVPDMLANRADVWNLGDVLSGREAEFALSYVENALTSNPVLAPLSGRGRGDLELLVRLARGEEDAHAGLLTHPYSEVEVAELIAVLAKLLRVRDVVLTVNRAYIASAATSDASRTEPPFHLQGSYRDMNALAARIVPVMNTAELESVIDDHYRAEAQTLASGAESNLLKLAELRNLLTPDQSRRWSEVTAAYRREQALGGADDDPVARAVTALATLTEQMGGIESALRGIALSTRGGRHDPAV